VPHQAFTIQSTCVLYIQDEAQPGILWEPLKFFFKWQTSPVTTPRRRSGH
jgi:hypothetical protein